MRLKHRPHGGRETAATATAGDGRVTFFVSVVGSSLPRRGFALRSTNEIRPQGAAPRVPATSGDTREQRLQLITCRCLRTVTSAHPVHLADPSTWRHVCGAERSERPPGNGRSSSGPRSATSLPTVSPPAQTTGEDGHTGPESLTDVSIATACLPYTKDLSQSVTQRSSCRGGAPSEPTSPQGWSPRFTRFPLSGQKR